MAYNEQGFAMVGYLPTACPEPLLGKGINIDVKN